MAMGDHVGAGDAGIPDIMRNKVKNTFSRIISGVEWRRHDQHSGREYIPQSVPIIIY